MNVEDITHPKPDKMANEASPWEGGDSASARICESSRRHYARGIKDDRARLAALCMDLAQASADEAKRLSSPAPATVSDLIDAAERQGEARALRVLAESLMPIPATCVPGCRRLASEGPGHPGACKVSP